MKTITTILTFLLFLSLIRADELPVDNNSAFAGRHFYVGFMENEIVIQDFLDLSIYITVSDDANITVFHRGAMSLRYEYTVQKDSVLKVEVPAVNEVRDSEIILNSLTEITSDVPVTVYAFSSQITTSDSYAVLPVSRWGTEYLTVNMPNDQYYIEGAVEPEDSLYFHYPRSGEFMVMAAYDSTVVEIIPSTTTWQRKQAGSVYTEVLNKGDCYLVKSYPASRGTFDLTGSFVRANKPVGVLSGHVRTAVPQELGPPWDSKDHLCEQLMPTEMWGRTFVSVPFGFSSHGDYIKFVSLHGGTLIEMLNEDVLQDIHISKSGGTELITGVNKPTVWKSNYPVQVAQLMAHSGWINDSRYYDPSMVILPPVEQFVDRILFHTPGDSRYNPGQYMNHYITLVMDKNAYQSIKLDYKPLATYYNGAPEIIVGSNLYWSRIEIDKGKHIIECDSGAFSGVIYGKGQADSYAMILGSSLRNPYSNDSIPPVVDVNERCGYLNGTIREYIDEASTGIDFVHVVVDSTDNYEWDIDFISDTATYITFRAWPKDIYTDAQFMIEIRDKNGNGRAYKHKYYGIRTFYPKGIYIPNVDVGEVACSEFFIQNVNDGPLNIVSAEFALDARLTFESMPALPATLQQYDSLKCKVCFDPGTDTTTLYAKLILNYDCDRKQEIPVRGAVDAPSLLALDYDFGDVLIGQKPCAETYIINTGNMVVSIDSLTWPDGSVFEIDDSNVPKILNPGDTVLVPLCFEPASRQHYEIGVLVHNDLNIQDVTFKVSGNGIAPEFDSIVLDWENRRVGTVNDSSVWVKNTGNSIGRLSFDTMIEGDSYNDQNTNFIKSIDIDINPADSSLFDFSYSPADTGRYYVNAELDVDWALHESVSLELIGYGTLPEIETYDIEFDTTVVYNQRSLIEKAIASFGNEILTVDEIYVSSGDEDEFEIDYDALKNLLIPYSGTDSLFNMPVIYKPTTIGDHELILSVVHDANPNYERSEKQIRITGVAIPADTFKIDMTVDEPDVVLPCHDNPYIIKYENDGDINARLDTVIITGEGVIIEPDQTITYPIDFAVGEEIYIPLNVIPESKAEAKFTAEAEFYIPDSLSSYFLSREIEVLPSPEKVIINAIPLVESYPGDTVKLDISGKLPYIPEIGSDFSFSLNIRMEDFYLLNKQSELILSNDEGDKQKIQIQLVQSLNNVQFSLPANSIPGGKFDNWSLSITFLTLLGTTEQQIVTLQAFSEPCYDGGNIDLDMLIEEVCIFSLRSVELITNLPGVEVYPNPANAVIKANVFLPESTEANIVIYSAEGKKIREETNLYLEKGSHSLIFDVSFLQNGVYVFSVQTVDYIKNYMFIISK